MLTNLVKFIYANKNIFYKINFFVILCQHVTFDFYFFNYILLHLSRIILKFYFCNDIDN